MVSFQCEDCGENLKKPKLPRHFSMCTATNLSCIDCGNMFGQDSVHYHNQCITEAEKYGPKGLSNGDNLKQQQLDFDINAELFNSRSWFCSLCNANMTCEQDYFTHAYGKKHREKAKEVADKQKQQSEQPTVDKDNLKQQPDLDIYVGLSNHYPWLSCVTQRLPASRVCYPMPMGRNTEGMSNGLMLNNSNDNQNNIPRWIRRTTQNNRSKSI